LDWFIPQNSLYSIFIIALLAFDNSKKGSETGLNFIMFDVFISEELSKYFYNE